MGKLSMQKIERKHLTLRTRLKRLAHKTLCFSRFSCEARPPHWIIHEPGRIRPCGLKESNYRIETLPFAVGAVGQTVPDQHSRATDIESKPPVQSPSKVFTPPASREEFDKNEELVDEPEPRSLSKTPERLDKPLKFRLPRSDRSDVMRVVSRIGEQVETSVEWSHVGRALVVLLRHVEGEIVKHARRNGPLVRPSNDQAIALAEFEQRIAQILLRAFREVSPLR